MTFSKFFTHFFFWSFSAFMAVHFAWVKQPSQNREIASWSAPSVKPWYNASWKQ